MANPNPNPNPNIPTMAFHFSKSLSNIAPSSSPLLRRHSITRAAYASMAAAAGPGRAWSRAMLRRLRGRRVETRMIVLKGLSRVGRLRRLVPGGDEMRLCRLLEESASYIQCLSAQVRLMETMVESIAT